MRLGPVAICANRPETCGGRWRSGWWKAACQGLVDSGDVRDLLGRLREHLGQSFGPEDLQPSYGEGTSDEWPVGVDEGQRTLDWRREPLGREGLGDQHHLLGDTVDELGAVTAAYEESLDPRSHDSAFDAKRRSPLVALGVNDPHPVARHRDVVDVGFGLRDPSIVKDRHTLVDEAVEPVAETFFADGALVPSAGRLRIIEHGEEQAAQLWVGRTDAVLAARLAAFELAARRGAGYPGRRGLILGRPFAWFFRGWRSWPLSDVDYGVSQVSGGVTVEATDGPGSSVVDRRGPGWELGGADCAGAGIPQAQRLRRGRLVGLHNSDTTKPQGESRGTGGPLVRSADAARLLAARSLTARPQTFSSRHPRDPTPHSLGYPICPACPRRIHPDPLHLSHAHPNTSIQLSFSCHTSGTSCAGGPMVPRDARCLGVTMSMRRMTLGAGFRYLMSSVARADREGLTTDPLTAYYTQGGTPPGRFLGSGLAGLAGGSGVEPGSVVTEEHLWRMLGMLQDPVTGRALGRAPVADRPSRRDAGGRRRPASRTVAGFDLTFSAPKSVSVAWAMADGPTRERICAAHQRALEFVIEYAEREVFTTRTGRGGVVSEAVRGVVATGFDHWDSRAGDPQLHTHAVVLNRVRAATDGAWRTLDSRALFKANVALSELYNGALMDLLTADLGWGWEARARARSTSPTWEVAGVGKELREEFSQRSTAINAAASDLIAGFADSRERQPTAAEVIRLRQQATLATRPDKELRPLANLVRDWRLRAKPHLGSEPQAWVATLANRCDLPALSAADLEDGMLKDAATVVVDAVAARRATFTRSNVLAEALRQLHGVRFTTPHERAHAAERVTIMALEASVQLSPPEVGRVPATLLRPDGSTRLRARDATIYTTTAVLEAEERLLAAGRATDGPQVHAGVASAAAGAPLPGRADGCRLTGEQADAVCRVVTSGRALDVLVGAAGTGKSTTMAGVRAAWEPVFGRGSVVGLAPSAAAAEVLADAVGVPTENTAKWLTEQARQDQRLAELASLHGKLRFASPSLRTRAITRRARQVKAELDRWRLRDGQLVIVDEASMVGTLELDTLTTQARQVGAKVLLVGDPAQLSPVAAGGAFRLLVTDREDAPELVDVRRFRHEWERTASLALRDGHPTAAHPYLHHGRVQDGDRDTMIEAVYRAWRADTRAGRTSLMVAADAQTVAELNARARADLVATGQVIDHGVSVTDGTTIGAGDVVVTRLNQRDLHAAGGWVKNGDQWRVSAVHADGSLTVHRTNKVGTTTRLPADYVREHVELGYATTAHRAQGRTVDTCHAYVSAATVREPLYVMATRGREANRLYIDTSYDPDTDTAHDLGDLVPVEEVLKKVLATSGAEISAIQTRDHEAAAASSPARLDAEGAAIQHHRRHQRYTDLLLAAGVPPEHIEGAKAANRWRPMLERMRLAEQLGLDLQAALQTASARGKPDQPLMARVDAGLAAWNAHHDTRRECDQRIRSEPPVRPQQSPRLE